MTDADACGNVWTGEGARFRLGRCVITRGALELAGAGWFNPAEVLSRHVACDWGNLCKEDEKALKNGERVLSAYELACGSKLYVITEWDRSVTTILLPEEY